MTATHFLGSDGEIRIDGNIKSEITDFSVDISVNAIASARVGQKSDKQYPGKVGITGSINEVLITPELLSMVIGDSDTLTTSTLESLLSVTEVCSSGGRQEIAITSNPAAPTSVKVTLTVGTVGTTAGSIVVHGTDVSNNYVTEVIGFPAMAVGDPSQVKYGSQVFKTTTFVDVEAALAKGDTPDCTDITIEGVTGTKTMTPGDATMFTIIGRVADTSAPINSAEITLNNCFFTGGNFPIGDADTLVACDLPFICQNPDTDMSLSWTSV